MGGKIKYIFAYHPRISDKIFYLLRPDPIGGLYYVYLDKTYISAYMSVYAGVQEIHPYYKTYDWFKFDENSARWAIDFVGNLLYLNWREGMKDLKAARDPLELYGLLNNRKFKTKLLNYIKMIQQRQRSSLLSLRNRVWKKAIRCL